MDAHRLLRIGRSLVRDAMPIPSLTRRKRRGHARSIVILSGTGDCGNRCVVRLKIVIAGFLIAALCLPLHAIAVTTSAIQGTDTSDSLDGTAGSDVIFGLGGDDRLRGRAGEDRLVGGRGHDLLKGGPGPDSYVCGPGFDVVVSDLLRHPEEQVGSGCEAVIFETDIAGDQLPQRSPMRGGAYDAS
jgi:Ca2+-binding RTX toxin-like protein